jgi:CDP-2,3-bis-(O-geranylgeranyl)-sn-glycerol synthase
MFGSVWMLAIFMVLSGGVANMAPLFARGIKLLELPIDNKIQYKGKRILGDGKTWRGVVAGILLSGVVGYIWGVIQVQFFSSYKEFWDVVWRIILYTAVAAYFGFFALFGDAVKSFAKRQVGIERGKSWIPFDQTDWIIGILLGALLLGKLRAELLLLLPVGLILHLGIKYIGHKLKIDDKAI